MQRPEPRPCQNSENGLLERAFFKTPSDLPRMRGVCRVFVARLRVAGLAESESKLNPSPVISQLGRK